MTKFLGEDQVFSLSHFYGFYGCNKYKNDFLTIVSLQHLSDGHSSNYFIGNSLYYCHIPTSSYLLKVNKRNTRTRCEICSKLTIKIAERRQWHYANFEGWYKIVKGMAKATPV